MFNFFKSKKVTRLRKNLKDSKFVIRLYEKLIEDSREIKTFEKFECSDFFKGVKLAKYNRVKLRLMKNRSNRQIKFLESILKEINTKYYVTYIGELTEDDRVRLNRNGRISKILK